MNTSRLCRCLPLLFVLLLSGMPVRADWQPAKGPLMTRWAKDVRPDKVHPEYPRPQMVRKDWLKLNGLWDYAIQPRKEARPEKFDGQLLVPFPVESALSGVMKHVSPEQRLWYRRTFDVPKEWAGKRCLLHFGAVDWETVVWVNGKNVGEHRGGYDPFTFDITDALKKDGEQELVVAVWDPTDQDPQPRGKQVRRPESIWYTPTTGIWQTVWLEPVAESHIRSLKIVPDIDSETVRVTVEGAGRAGAEVRLQIDSAVIAGTGKPAILDPAIKASGKAGEEISLEIPHAGRRLWSPDRPWLYGLQVELLSEGKVVDSVNSYFGMRKISLGKDDKGVTRILLNNKPLFQYGPLDQGFWPDGLYTAPTDEALRYDLEMTKKLGFNMVRKHVKVEPARWYYHCDKLGLLVWQDMPSGDASVAPGKGEIKRSKESAENFERELKAMIATLRNHPCIVLWVPFNEGWGQYDTKRIADLVKKEDPTRLVTCTSGWNDVADAGDVHDIHVYPGPGAPKPEAKRAIVLGEFGGLGLPLSGHTWQAEKNWGYRSFNTQKELTAAYLQLAVNLRMLIARGLSAAVYTQTTDVEVEVNGLLTYDRAVVKMDEKRITEANKRLYLPPPEVSDLVPTSQQEAQEWQYTTWKKAEGWEKPDYKDMSWWKKGPGGFGTKGTPGAIVRTEWRTSNIWLRRTFELTGKLPPNLHLLIHHDEDAEVYFNGRLVAKFTGYTTDYILVPLDEEAVKALKMGLNTLAVHCRQTTGGQYIDVGLVSIREARPPK
jgi:hypothetical protein